MEPPATTHPCKEMCFVIEEKEIYADKDLMFKKSPYLKELVSSYPTDQEIRILLPKWATVESFKLLLKLIKREEQSILDYKLAQRILWLSDFLKIKEIEDKCINEFILPKLKKDNALEFLIDAYAKLKYTLQIEEIWESFFEKCISFIAANIHYYVKYNPKLFDIEPEALERIIEESFKHHSLNINGENDLIVEALLKLRKSQDVFELLKSECSKVVADDKELFLQDNIKPTLTWKIGKLTKNYYKESEQFYALGTYWVLIAWCSEHEGCACISIKSSKVILNEEEKEYCSKTQYSTAKKQKPQTVIDSEKKTKEKSTTGEASIPNHSILTIASLIRIEELEDEGEGDFLVSSLITASKMPTILRRVSLKDLEPLDGGITLQIYMKLEFIYSGILSHISKSFNWMYNEQRIKSLSRNQFLVLLRHKFLNVKKEDDAVSALCIWRMSIRSDRTVRFIRPTIKGYHRGNKMEIRVDECAAVPSEQPQEAGRQPSI